MGMGREIDFATLWQSAVPMQSFREPRHSVMMHATVSVGPAAASARIRNISRGGMMAEFRFRGAPGARVAVLMRGIGEVAGAVAWVEPGKIGVMFDEPIDPTEVLRKPTASTEVSYAPPVVERAWRPPLHSGQ